VRSWIAVARHGAFGPMGHACRILLVLSAVAVVEPRAHADDPSRHKWEWGDDRAGFAEHGQLTLSNDAAFQVQQRAQSNGRGRAISVVLAPSFDYFVIRNVSVGGLFGYTFTKAGGDKSQRFSVGPRVGYNVELTGMYSFWPRIGLSYAYSTDRQDGSAGRGSAVALNVSLPLMIHPVRSFFLGFGPYVDTDLSGSPRVTQFGGKLTMGGAPLPDPSERGRTTSATDARAAAFVRSWAGGQR